jgi:hypothetical protein
MMKKLALLLLCAGTLAAAPHRLQAQETSTRRQAASELLTLMNADSLVLQGVMTLLDMQLRSTPDMQHFRGVMEDFMRETLAWDRIGPLLVDLYAETYTEAELHDIIAFYRTPTGRRLLETQSELTARAAEIGNQQVQARMDVLQRLLAERAAELEEKGVIP